MKTTITRQRWFSMKNFSSFSEVALMVAVAPLLPICLGVPMLYAYILVAIFLAAIVVANIWTKIKEAGMETHLKEERSLNESINEDGGIDYETFYRFLMWVAGISLAFFVAIVGLVIFWKEIGLLIAKNSIPIILAILGVVITAWLARAENKKERQERRYANKILADKGPEPLKE